MSSPDSFEKPGACPCRVDGMQRRTKAAAGKTVKARSCGSLNLKRPTAPKILATHGSVSKEAEVKGRPVPQDSPYPHLRRLKALFNASLAKPTSPYVVGEQIRQIVESDSWQLRYPIGPDAEPFLKWRASKTDEEVVNQAAQSDPDYKARVKREFGLDLDL